MIEFSRHGVEIFTQDEKTKKYFSNCMEKEVSVFNIAVSNNEYHIFTGEFDISLVDDESIFLRQRQRI